MKTYDLIVASSSPRRHQFIKQLGFDFIVINPNIDESIKANESPYEHVQRLAEQKCQSVSAKYSTDLVLAADTIVVVDNEILGKPKDQADAKAMLLKLQGREHEVLTAVCVAKADKLKSFVCSTKVVFAALSESIIDEYLKTHESDDKSGSYAVQGIAAMFILEVKGSVSSVVGLPLAQTRELLEDFGLFYKFPG